MSFHLNENDSGKNPRKNGRKETRVGGLRGKELPGYGNTKVGQNPLPPRTGSPASRATTPVGSGLQGQELPEYGNASIGGDSLPPRTRSPASTTTIPVGSGLMRKELPPYDHANIGGSPKVGSTVSSGASIPVQETVNISHCEATAKNTAEFPEKVEDGSSQNRRHHCVHVGNLPFETSRHQLWDLFSQVGKIEIFDMPIDRLKKSREFATPERSRGWATIGYRHVSEAEAAIDAFNNRIIKIKGERPERERERKMTVEEDRSHRSLSFALVNTFEPDTQQAQRGVRVKFEAIPLYNTPALMEVALLQRGAKAGTFRMWSNGCHNQVAVIEFPSTEVALKAIAAFDKKSFDGTSIKARIMKDSE